MSTVGSYPVSSFSPSQYFLIYNPSTQTLDRVLGSELVTYVTQNADYVRAVSTRAVAQTLDFDIGIIVQTGGDLLPGDGGQGTFLVVASGSGTYAMNNGNDLLLLPFGSLAGSDLDGATITDSGTTTNIEVAVSRRQVVVPSVADLYGGDWSQYDYLDTQAFTAGGFVGGADWYKNGTGGTPTTSGTLYTHLALGYVIDQGGNYWYMVILPSEGVLLSRMGCVSDAGTTDNYNAIVAAYALAVANNCRVVKWDGKYGFGTKVVLPANVSTIGNEGWFASGSSMPECSIIWTGGATPMFDMSVTRVTFRGLSVGNSGTATDFIEMNSGAQRLFLDWVFLASAPDFTRFSRSFVRSNGNRLGYSKVTNIYAAGSPAPVLFDVDGQGTGNGITTFTMRGGIISASGANMTALKVTDENLEVVNIEDITWIDDGAFILKAVDTTATPIVNAIQTLNFTGNEVEIKYGTSTEAFMELENVITCNFKNNQIDGTGTENQVINSTNSCVVVDGNTFIQVPGTEVVDADDDSTVIAGVNNWAGTTSVPICTNLAATTRRVTQSDATARIIDLSTAPNHGEVVREINVNTASGFSIRATLADATPGMVLTVVIRNVSGGVIAAPSFFSTHYTLESTSPTAPADGNCHSYTFYYNGTTFTELRRNEGAIANT